MNYDAVELRYNCPLAFYFLLQQKMEWYCIGNLLAAFGFLPQLCCG
jgi:hypothetical protein